MDDDDGWDREEWPDLPPAAVVALSCARAALAGGDEQGAQQAARIALAALDWDEIELVHGQNEVEIHCHERAIPGFMLCDGSGRVLVWTQNLPHLLVPGRSRASFGALAEVPCGLWPLEQHLVAGVDEALVDLQRFHIPDDWQP